MVDPLTVFFPGLGNSLFERTSPPTRAYNCIAWAAGDTLRWWWPATDPENDAVYWPPGVPVEETLEACTAALVIVGYEPCSGEEFEPGMEQIALFAKDGAPTHAARQLANGRWVSRLGARDDVEHDLHAVGGSVYGRATVFLKRPVAAPIP